MKEMKTLPKNWYLLIGVHGQNGQVIDTQVIKNKQLALSRLRECENKIPRMQYFTYKLKTVELVVLNNE